MEVAVSTGSLGVDLHERHINDVVDRIDKRSNVSKGTYNALGNTLAIKVSEEVDMMEI